MSLAALPESPLEKIQNYLAGLKMVRSLEVLGGIVQDLEQGRVSGLEAIATLLNEELQTRETRRIRMSLMTARLTRVKTLETFDFSFQPSLDRNRILALAQLGFVSRGETLHLLGPPGTGKTHLATALGVNAVKAGKSVFFATLTEIITSLKKAEQQGSLKERLTFLSRPALLIVDEVGYLPLAPGGANLFFQLVNARYERGAMILTSNRGFKEWGQIFGDNVVAAALLDRLLHHAVVVQIDGNSYRLREHAGLLRLKSPGDIEESDTVPVRRGRPRKVAPGE